MVSVLRTLFSTRVLSLWLPDIILIYSCYILAAYWAVGTDPSVYLLYDNGLLQISVATAGLIAGLQLNRLYAQPGVRSKMLLLQRLALAVSVPLLLESLLGYLQVRDLVLVPSIMLAGSGLVLPVLLVWRIFYSKVLWRGFGPQRVLFYGTNAAALEVSRSLAAHPERGLFPIGYIDDERPVGTTLNGVRVLGATADLERLVSELRPGCIVVGVTERRRGVPFATLLDLQFQGMEIEPVSALYEMACERACMAEMPPSQLIFSGELGARPSAIALQAIYSNLIALAGLLFLAIVFLPVALAIKLTSRGPVLEAQRRLGLNLMPFTLYYFRCRRQDGTVTGPGRWLRHLHLDALPHMVNVIRGEMSVVGPRPHRPEFIRMLMERLPYYGQRHAVRPGILGWSQLHCDYGGLRDAREALEYDLYYIKHVSPALDAYIILHSLMETSLGEAGGGLD
jgi:lipopolysaccharide/colanic/teichoic acid biosynthesis glycosyltransferase